MNDRVRSHILILLGLLCIPCLATASPLEIGGFDARAMALAGTQTAATTDHTATLYNPGALTQGPASFGAGWMMTVPRLEIRLARAPNSLRTQPVYPSTRHGVTVGAVFPIGEGLNRKLALGVGIYSPTDYTAKGQLLSTQTPRFYRFQNRSEKFVGLMALAIEVTEWLHVGTGFQLIGDLLGQVAVDIRLSDRQVKGKSVYVEFPLKMAATAGLLLKPTAGLRVGAAWRQQIALDFSIPSQLIIDDAADLEIIVEGTALYTPESFNFGLAYQLPKTALQLSAGISWVRWSKTPDPSLKLGLDLEGDLLSGLGLDERLDLKGSSAVDLALRDVWQPRVGAELDVLPFVALRAGYSWRPAPAPLPTGPFNFIDPSSHRLAAGIGVRIANPMEEKARPLHIDIGYSLTLLQEIVVSKRASTNDPVGDYTAGGQQHAVTVSLKQEL
jgi:hypothetical protein